MTTELVPYPSIEGSECPYPFYRHLVDEAPIYRHPLRDDLYLVARREDVHYVFAHPELFSSHRTRGALTGDAMLIANSDVPMMTELDGGEHKLRRDLGFAPLKPGRLRRYEPVIRELVDEVIDGFAGDGRVEFVEGFSYPLPVKVTCRLLGIPPEHEPWVREWSHFETAGVPWMPAEFVARQREKGARMFAYLTYLVEERHRNPGDDVISEVVAAQVGRDGTLNVAEVRAVSAALLAGGVVTTAHFMASAMLLLLENPDQLAKVQAEPGLIPRCTEEALRLEAPTQWTPRRAVQDVELAGVSIPAGAFVLLLQGACNRDPAVFDQPDQFDVTRPNATDHLSFGYGPHFCLGAPLARLEVRVAFEQLLARLDNLRLAPGNELTHNPSPQFRGLRRLELEFG